MNEWCAVLTLEPVWDVFRLGTRATLWCLPVMNQLWLILPLWGLGRAAVAVLQYCWTAKQQKRHTPTHPGTTWGQRCRGQVRTDAAAALRDSCSDLSTVFMIITSHLLQPCFHERPHEIWEGHMLFPSSLTTNASAGSWPWILIGWVLV